MSNLKRSIIEIAHEESRPRPGAVKSGTVKSINFPQSPANTSPNFNPHIKLTKRSYNFDRGNYFALTPEHFISYGDRTANSEVNTVNGNFTDNVASNYVNTLYGFLIYSERARTVSFKINAVQSSIVIYAGTNFAMTKIYSSENSAFPTGGTINIELGAGEWTAVRIFHYQRFKQGAFEISGDLGLQITAWSVIDIEPPPTPTWTSLTTDYSDNRVGSSEVTIRWKNPLMVARDDADGLDYTDLGGTGIYRADGDGWDTLGTVTSVSGVYFTISGSILPLINSSVKYNNSDNSISGVIQGYEYNVDNSETTIWLEGDDTAPSVTDIVLVEGFKHLIDLEYNRNTTQQYLEFIDTDVQAGDEYNYKLDFYDDSFLRNRSDKTSVSGIFAGDSTPPAIVTNLANEALDEDTIRFSWTAPTDNDLNGFHLITNYSGYLTTIASVTSNNIFDITSGISNFEEGGFLTITISGSLYLRKIRLITGNQIKITQGLAGMQAGNTVTACEISDTIEGRKNYVDHPDNES